MLLFKKKFLDLIRCGRKTQTIRVWPHRKMRVGQRSYIPGAGYVRVEAVEEVTLGELTEDDARRDGFATASELRTEIARLYPSATTTTGQPFRVVFRILTEEEQEAAVQERERRKQSRLRR